MITDKSFAVIAEHAILKADCKTIIKQTQQLPR